LKYQLVVVTQIKRIKRYITQNQVNFIVIVQVNGERLMGVANT